MKFLNIFISLIVTISTVLGVDIGYGRNPKKRTIDLSGYKQVWSDEFDGDSLNTDKWNDNQNVDTIHWGAVRKGGFWHRDLISVRDGALHIGVRYVDEKQAAEYGGDYKAGWYTGYVTTYNSNPDNKSEPDTFLRGYYETRCILPEGEGLWSAFWFMNKGVYNADSSGKDGTEIDVFESLNYRRDGKKTSDLVSINLHWDGYDEDHKHFHVGDFYPENPYKEFNTYGVEWTEDEYIFYINGHECARTDKGGVSENPECMLLSVEIAGDNGIASGRGDINLNTGNREFIVDYVRVYQK